MVNQKEAVCSTTHTKACTGKQSSQEQMVWPLDFDKAMQVVLFVACSQIYLIRSLDSHLLIEVPEKKTRYVKILYLPE